MEAARVVHARTSRADYGVDAPGVIRTLALASIGCVILASLFPRLAWMAFPATFCAAEAVWMLWSSRSGKITQREVVLDAAGISGDEAVLDIGCGRGLLTVGAARRLPAGRAVGVDIWSSRDLSGNGPDAVAMNAAAEGVADRVEVHTGDARKLPFPDASFDVIVSSLAIHNISARSDRERAIAEAVRVLRPGGRIVIQDFQSTGLYVRALENAGMRDITRSGLYWRIFPPARIVRAVKPE